MTGDITVQAIWDDEGRKRAVVIQADEEIAISDELWQEALDPDRERFAGDIEIDADQVSFGTPGEGLGRLTYVRTGQIGREHIAVRRRDGSDA